MVFASGIGRGACVRSGARMLAAKCCWQGPGCWLSMAVCVCGGGVLAPQHDAPQGAAATC